MARVSTNGIETYYDRQGSGPPIVFVHGAIVDGRQWSPQFEGLRDEYTVVTYDVRGHGRTGGSDVARYSINLLADDLHALVTALDLERPVICGLSMGGCIAQVYAARHPDRIAGLVLADTFGPQPIGLSEWLQRVVLLRALVPPVRVLGYERVERAMVWLQERVSGEGVSGEYDQIQQLRSSGQQMSTGEFSKVIHALTSFHETAIELDGIAVPTLVMYGEHDAPFLRRQALSLGVTIPKASVVEVPGAGHVANLDNPSFVTDALQDHLEAIFEAAPE